MKTVYKLCIILILGNLTLLAQNLDSLFYEFTSKDLDFRQEINRFGGKPTLMTTKNIIRLNYDSFSEEQKQMLSPMFQRYNLDTSIVSPSGNFRIHYDLSGDNKPAYGVDELAQILDHVYDFQVNQLGFLPPPPDGQSGGDSKYDVYIKRSSSTWGNTHFEDQITADTWTSYMDIDNDFSDKRIKGLDAVKITCAHELHHAIQIGNYAYRSADVFFYEMTSTSMEEFMYDNVNDYYFEIHNYFNSLNRSINKSPGNGYDTTIWLIFLKEKFGIEIVKEIWELVKIDRALGAISRAIEKRGSTFKKEFEDFSDWIYFTGSRAKEGKYFEEARFYPEIKPVNKFEIVGDEYTKEMMYFTQGVSNNYVSFIDSATAPVRDFMVRITNSDFGAANTYGTATQVNLRFTKGLKTGSKVAYDYYSKIEVISNDQVIGAQYFLNGDFASEAVDDEDKNFAEFVFPQPFSPGKHSEINFTAPQDDDNIATLYIYSLTMELLYSSDLHLQKKGEDYILNWNGIDNRGNKLSSGVYIYVIDSSDKKINGKFAVLND